MLRLIASCSLTSPAGHGKGGTLMPPPPFGPAATFAQFGHTPTQLIPAAPPMAARHTFPVAYPPIFYWPYPSPPVSPTSYYGGPMPAALGPPQGPMQPPQPTLVIMQGLPYSANVGHVLNFFSGSPERNKALAQGIKETNTGTHALLTAVAEKQGTSTGNKEANTGTHALLTAVAEKQGTSTGNQRDQHWNTCSIDSSVAEKQGTSTGNKETNTGTHALLTAVAEKQGTSTGNQRDQHWNTCSIDSCVRDTRH
uniref:Uncharacterized protein n=1 Tax=Timema monikensis TaxID=170555 RepID=A0A7R9HRE7_9NEOP|nr:unnamed protein product [Timema monikensis]